MLWPRREAAMPLTASLRGSAFGSTSGELNVTKEDIREIADCGQVLGDYANNPRVATIPEMYELLMSCYDRK